jgi:hypothetical protein
MTCRADETLASRSLLEFFHDASQSASSSVLVGHRVQYIHDIHTSPFR